MYDVFPIGSDINPQQLIKRIKEYDATMIEDCTINDVLVGDVMRIVVSAGESELRCRYVHVIKETPYYVSDSFRVFMGTTIWTSIYSVTRKSEETITEFYSESIPRGFATTTQCQVVRKHNICSYINRLRFKMRFRIALMEWMKNETNYAKLHNVLWKPPSGIMPRAILRDIASISVSPCSRTGTFSCIE